MLYIPPTYMNAVGISYIYVCIILFFKPEPIMLLILPIVLSRISHNFYPLFFIYSHAITYYSSNLIVSLHTIKIDIINSS